MHDARLSLGLAAALTLAAGAATRADEQRPLSLSFVDPPAPEAVAPSAPAQPGSGAPMPEIKDLFAPDWTIGIDPTLWFVGPSGKFKLPVNSGTGPGGFTTEGDKIKVNDVDLESTRLRPAGTLTVASGPWRFSFWGSEYDLSRADAVPDFSGRLGAVAFASGDHLKLDLSLGTYEATAGYRIFAYDYRERTNRKDAAIDAQLILHLIGGVRLYDVEMSAENLGSGARAEASHFFAEPIIGVRAEAIVDDDFSVILQLSAGGMPLYSTSSYSLDIVAAFQWRPTKNLGIQLGWRQLAFDLSNGKDLDRFQYTGRLAGLFTGVTIRF